MSTVQAALTLQGERKTGQSVRTQNVMAASSIANIVKSSLGKKFVRLLIDRFQIRVKLVYCRKISPTFDMWSPGAGFNPINRFLSRKSPFEFVF